MTISILTTGCSNNASVLRMIHTVGGRATFISTPEQVAKASKLVLPGVGHFAQAMNDLRQLGLADAIKERVSERSVPLLGVCLGMQLLCAHSEEGDTDGLGLVDADVKHFTFPPSVKLKIPHMGWNTVRVLRENAVLPSDQPKLRFYFVHSYYVDPRDPNITTATTHFGHDFCAAFQHNSIIGVQFHPEKSHRFGMALMKRFVEL